jgi:hypothetical protein
MLLYQFAETYVLALGASLGGGTGIKFLLWAESEKLEAWIRKMRS